MRIRFWGTRGSLARPGKSTIRYGGNTPCVEVQAEDGCLVVLDAGTGIFELGQELNKRSDLSSRGHLLIGHTHWDHIQGFPFFAPLFAPDNEWDIYAPGGLGRSLEATLTAQMDYHYFPVSLQQLKAEIRYHDLIEGHRRVGSFLLTTHYLNHPALTLGYRLEVGGVSVAYAVDHEPHEVPGIEIEETTIVDTEAQFRHMEDTRHLEFISGVDVLIHDAQYTLAEYPLKVGWGHTPAEIATDLAIEAKVKKLVLFHHDPNRTDDAMDKLVEVCRQRAQSAVSSLEILGAAEGQQIEVAERGYEEGGREFFDVPASKALAAGGTEAKRSRILIVDNEPEVLAVLHATLEPEGFLLSMASSSQEALEHVKQSIPRLILVDADMPEIDGMEVCRQIRAHSDGRMADVPVLLLAAQTTQSLFDAGKEVGVTDYLPKPLTPALIRTRVRAWLIRYHHDAISQ